MAENLLQALQAIERDLPPGPALDAAQQARSYASSCFESADDVRCLLPKGGKK
jgi:hypothetical protein